MVRCAGAGPGRSSWRVATPPSQARRVQRVAPVGNRAAQWSTSAVSSGLESTGTGLPLSLTMVTDRPAHRRRRSRRQCIHGDADGAVGDRRGELGRSRSANGVPLSAMTLIGAGPRPLRTTAPIIGWSSSARLTRLSNPGPTRLTSSPPLACLPHLPTASAELDSAVV